MPKNLPTERPTVSSVTVTPCPHGVQAPLSSRAITMNDYSNQPPSQAIIGEAVSSVIENMWKSGYDPALPDFVLLVTFK